MPGDVLCSESPPRSEGFEPVRKKLRLDITFPGDDAGKPQLDIDISGTRKYVSSRISILNLYYLHILILPPSPPQVNLVPKCQGQGDSMINFQNVGIQ